MLYKHAMKHLFKLIVLAYLPFIQANYPIKCSQLDFVYSTSNCCDENNDATCLQAIPHEKYRSDVTQLEDTLVEIGLCSTTDASCIKDLPSLTYLRDRIKNITDGGVDIAVEVATSKQDKHPNLESISNGFLPSLELESNGILTIPAGATLKVDGVLNIPQLNTGATAATATVIGHLQVDEIHSPVDFNHHFLSEVNLKGPFQIDSVDVLASAAELNILKDIDTSITFNDINKLKNLEADASDLNALHDSGVTKTEFQRLDVAVLGESEANKVVTADASGNVVFKHNVEIDGDLNIPHGKLKINGVIVDKSATQLNDAVAHFAGLTASSAEINTLDGIVATSAELNKLHLVTADKDELNRLDITTEGASEAGKVVTADAQNKVTFSGDVDVTGTLDATTLKINGVAVTSTASELNILSGVTATAEQLNSLVVATLGQSEPGKALVPDANGDITLNGDLVMGAGTVTSTTFVEKTDGNLRPYGTATSVGTKTCVLDGTEVQCCIDFATANNADHFFMHTDGSCETYALGNAPTFTGGLGVAYEAITTTTDVSRTLTVPKDALHIGSDAITASAAEINILDGVDAGLTAAHLNPLKDFTGDWSALDVLSGVTATNDELNMLDIAQVGLAEALKVVTSDANNQVQLDKLKVLGEMDTEKLLIGGVEVTTSATQLNQFDGFTADASSLNKLTDLVVGAPDLNKLKDVTADATDLNRADISTVGQSEASKVVTSDANGDVSFNGKVTINGGVEVNNGQLNISGTVVTATAAEINKLDAMTSTAAELNTLHGITLGQSSASKAVTADASGNVQFNGDVVISGDLDIPSGKLKLGGALLDASHDGGDINDATNHFLGLTVTADELNILDDIQATTAELNKLHLVAATTAELNYLAGVTLGQAEASKVVTTDASNKATIPNVDATVLDVTTFKLSGNAVTASAADLNRLSGLTATAVELNKMDGFSGTAADLSKLSGLTATAAELNTLDGVDASLTTAHLNVMKDVTASAAELNKVTGLTASVAQLDKVKDLTATAAELNVLDGAVPGVVTANKAVIADSNGGLSSAGTVTVTGTLDASVLKIDGVAVTAPAADLNSVATLSTHKTKLLDLATVTSTAAEIDDAVTKAAIVSTSDMTKLSELTATSEQLNTCANFLISQSADAPTCTQFGQMVYLTKTNGDTELHFCKSATESIGPLA